MPTIARLIGGAGTGKTTELMRIMDGVLDHVRDPHIVGFVSFTTAARREAASRAADRFDVPINDLEKHGWFRTLHSVCYQCLGIESGMLLTDTKEGREWIENAIQESVSLGTPLVDEGATSDTIGDAAAARALTMWHAARNSLESFDALYHLASACDHRTPPREYCREIIQAYETAKRVDHRLDFTDLLAAFAGWSFTLDGPSRCTPLGMPPDLPVWFFDEQQDTSPLLDSVCHRLIASPACEWVYVVGDPFQAIYGWAGADSRCFRAWPAAKERIMPQSHRCPAPILALGERLLRGCSDYFDRNIKPAEHTGVVERERFESPLLGKLDPRHSWLVIARTNLHAARLGRHLTAHGVPWAPTRGNGDWIAPERNKALEALLSLQRGEPIDGAQWRATLKYLPGHPGGVEMLTRGTKTRFEHMTNADAIEQHPWVSLDTLAELGGTPALQDAVRRGQWQAWIPMGKCYADARKHYDEATVQQPSIRVGTIHSVKGAEADNVAVLTTSSEPVVRSANPAINPRGYDEEQRVWYVAATRAKRRLVVLDELKPPVRKNIPV